MSKKEDAAFEDWKKELLGGLKPENRVHFEALLADDSEGVREHFRAGMREAEFYRRLNEMTEERRKFEREQRELEEARGAFESKQQEILNWYKEEAPKNERLLKEKELLAQRLHGAQDQLRNLGLEEEARALGVESRTSLPNAGGESALEKEVAQLRATLANIDQNLPGYLAKQGTVMLKIAQEGWKSVDPEKVMAYSTKNRVDPMAAFEHLTREERAEREAAKLADLEKKWKEEGRKEAMAAHPSPDRQRPSGPSIVDAIRGGQGLVDSRSRVGAAVAEFLAMENTPQ